MYDIEHYTALQEHAPENPLGHAFEAAPVVSIVCPFFNEEAILSNAILHLLDFLTSLKTSWEVIVVNDGSLDNSVEIAREFAQRDGRLRVLSYERNRGRGYALRTGIQHARGDYVITTEIDLSWGDDIVHRIYDALAARADVDMVVASPHLEGGGYRNVPAHRVLLSKLGNIVLRLGIPQAPSMNTGMTRGYRRQAIERLALYEDGKEFHLEVVVKALAAGLNISEVPAVLEWKDHKLASAGAKKRKSSSKVRRLVKSHLLFGVFAAPIRYLWALSGVWLALAMTSFFYAAYRFCVAEPYAYGILGCLISFVLSLLFFGLGVITEQNRILSREMWRLQSHLRLVLPTKPVQAEMDSSQSSQVPVGHTTES